MPETSSNPPITIAPMPAQIGTLMVSLSFTDSTSGPILVSCVSFV